MKRFVKDKKIKDFKVVNNIYELKNYRIDFLNFGSVLQYIKNYKNILSFLENNKPKYILISAMTLFQGKSECKQFMFTSN